MRNAQGDVQQFSFGLACGIDKSVYVSADNNLQNAAFHPAGARAGTQQKKVPLKGDCVPQVDLKVCLISNLRMYFHDGTMEEQRMMSCRLFSVI